MDVWIVTFGAFCGGFVSGLAGFGTGITAMGIWLYALSPQVAATLVIVCSVVAQLQTLPKVWHAIDRDRVLRFVIPGLIGVPVGTLLLSFVDARTFKLSIATLLILYSTWQLIPRSRSRGVTGSASTDRLVGLVSGVFGGLAGLSGPMMVIWSSFKSWSKDERRSTLQAFNCAVLLLALFTHLLAGQISSDLLKAVAVALPGTILGAWVGSRLYVAASESFYQRILFVLLLTSGVVLIWTNW